MISAQLPLAIGWPETRDFDHFVAGVNQTAVNAVREAATSGHGSLLLLGSAGSGKSHLLQAATNAANGCDQTALYIPLSAYQQTASEYIDPASLFDTGDYDLLCLDEIDAVSIRKDWALALLRLLDQRRQGNQALLLAARNLSSELMPDLVTRLTACARYTLSPLTDEQQLDALRMRAHERGLTLPPDVADYLIRRLPRDLAKLLDTLDTLDCASLSAQRRLTIPFVQATLFANRPQRMKQPESDQA